MLGLLTVIRGILFVGINEAFYYCDILLVPLFFSKQFFKL